MTHSAHLACRRLLLISLAITSVTLTALAPAAEEENAESPAKSQVTLIVDYGDAMQKRFDLPWRNELTVFEALQAAAEHPRGIKLASRGKGATVFVTKIDDCENEGSGRNWTYRVNDKSATQSCGIAKVAAGDVILWRFLSSR